MRCRTDQKTSEILSVATSERTGENTTYLDDCKSHIANYKMLTTNFNY